MNGVRGVVGPIACAVVTVMACHTAIAEAQDGVLDPNFGNGGVVEIPWPAGYAEANAVGIDSQGRIVVGGDAMGVFGDADFALFRLLPEGSIDGSFASGDGAFRLVDFNLAGIGGRSGDQINDLVVQGDDSVVAIGEAHFGLVNSQFALIKTDSSGELDPAFADNGSAHFGFDTFMAIDQGSLIRMDNAGRIVVSGTVAFMFNDTNTIDYWVGAARLTPQGQLDSNFFGGGQHYTPLWGDKSTVPTTVAIDNFPSAFVFDSDQRVVTAGTFFEPFPQDVALMRWLPDGGYDYTFGTQSIARVRLLLANGTAGGMVAVANGKLMISGTYGDSLPDTPFLARLDEAGSPDATFANNGWASTTPLGGGYFANFNFLASTKAGGWLLVGQYGVVDGPFIPPGVILVRFDASGAPDAGFGNNGVVTIVPDPNRVFSAHRVALQSDGKLVVAGSFPNSASDNTSHFAVLRILADYDTLFVSGFEAPP
jgi:uncharacterized delta-60 repeat protein